MSFDTNMDSQCSPPSGGNEAACCIPSTSPLPPITNFHLLLFGDQTAASDLQTHIKNLYQRSSRSYSLQAFLQHTADALQNNIAELNPTERQHFPALFQSILDLAEFHQHQGISRDVVLSTVLFCIAQLGSLIMYVDTAFIHFLP